jgi:hypothetical protein
VEGLKPLLRESSLSLLLTSDSEMMSFLPLLIPFLGAEIWVECWGSVLGEASGKTSAPRSGDKLLSLGTRLSGPACMTGEVEASIANVREEAWSSESQEQQRSVIRTDGLDLGMEKVKEFPEEDLLRCVQA